MPQVTQIVGVKAQGTKNNKPWQITTIRLDSGQLAETFDMVAIGDNGTLTYNDKYSSYSFKKDKAGAPSGTPAGATSTPGAQQPAARYQPKDEAAIKAMWAIGQAVQLAIAAGADKVGTDEVEVKADLLFAMVDRVKQGGRAIEAVSDPDRPPIELYDDIPEEIIDDI